MTPKIKKLMKDFDIDEDVAKTALKLIEGGMEEEQAVGRATFM